MWFTSICDGLSVTAPMGLFAVQLEGAVSVKRLQQCTTPAAKSQGAIGAGEAFMLIANSARIASPVAWRMWASCLLQPSTSMRMPLSRRSAVNTAYLLLQGCRSRCRTLLVRAGAQISSNDLKNGVTLEIDGAPYKVIEFLHVKPGKGAAFVRTKLKNCLTGGNVDKTFRAGEMVNSADMSRREGQFTYAEGDEVCDQTSVLLITSLLRYTVKKHQGQQSHQYMQCDKQKRWGATTVVWLRCLLCGMPAMFLSAVNMSCHSACSWTPRATRRLA